MKSYCKPKKCNIESVKFNTPAVFNAFTSKLKRGDFQEVLIQLGGIKPIDLYSDILNGSMVHIIPAIDNITSILTKRIKNRDLELKPIRQFDRVDGISRKLRHLCHESVEQQIFEYIAVHALMPLFKTRILPCQFASVPGRGQTPGKRKLERLLRRKFHCKIESGKCDIHHAYPSTTIELVMKLLKKDIHKNKTLLWFIEALSSNYPNSTLIIGGYLSTWLFNYIMSFLIQYLFSLYSVRRGKRKKMVLAVVCYADDFVIFGRRSLILKALKKADRWVKENLNLSIKSQWELTSYWNFNEEKVNKASRDRGRKWRCPRIDMMGYVVRRTYTIIRRKVYVRVRKHFIRGLKELETLGYIPWYRARKIIAYWGFVVNTNSMKFREKYQAKKVYKASTKSISYISKIDRMEDIKKYERKLFKVA